MTSLKEIFPPEGVIRPDKGKHAFSLVELLVVISIIGVLAILSGAAISGMQQAGLVNQATLNISLLLDQARSYAMANDTYVWVGFNSDESKGRLQVAAVGSLTGSTSDLTSATRLIAKIQSYDNIRLYTVGTLAGMQTNGAEDISQSTLSFRQEVGNQNVAFGNALEFDPSGSVHFKNSIQRWINVGLQPFFNGNANDKNCAVFQIAGLTGELNIFRQ